jgi:predicted dehydrogenase
MSNNSRSTPLDEPVKYAVVGLGYIAQAAVLPAFQNAENSRLVALVSNDPIKLNDLGDMYNIEYRYSYEDYDKLLKSGLIDAVYIALPNDMHCAYTVRAAACGIHVLCEKPMAVTEAECEEMIAAAESNDVRLMIAYRLHFEEANLGAIEIVRSGQIGEPRIFQSLFSMQVRDENYRVKPEHGGGSLYDIGVYCINAARYIFQGEPVDVFAVSASSSDQRFKDVDEMTSAILRFPNDRLAAFTSSFGAADVDAYQVAGTKGHLRLESAYLWNERLTSHLTVDGKTTSKTFDLRDHFAPEIINFSQCIRDHSQPEPSGYEGLADVRIIEALYKSADTGRPVTIKPVAKGMRPSKAQEIHRPPITMPELVHAQSPTR